MPATAAPSRRKQHDESLREESMISFEMELDEAIELTFDASVVELADAAQGARFRGKTATLPVPRAASQHTVTQSQGSTSRLRVDESRNGKDLQNTAGTTDGVDSPVVTPANGATITDSMAVPSRMLTWKDTSASQRHAEAQASRQQEFNPMVLCPLQNLGNTCYFNAGVQLLVNCPALVYAVRSSPFAQRTRRNVPPIARAVPMPEAAANGPMSKLCLKGGAATHTLFKEFSALLARMELGCADGERAISPICALDSLARAYPQFEGRSQQDAAEMMASLLASLEEEGGQYVEVTQLLQSFEEDAAALRHDMESVASSPLVPEPAMRILQGAISPPLEADTAPSVASNPHEHSEPCTTEEYSQPSLLYCTSENSLLPGPRSAHFLTVLRLMERVNHENELLEQHVKKRRGMTGASTFKPPRLHFNPLLDSFRGYALSEVKCHNCRAVSRVVSAYNGLLLDVPTPKQRRRYALAHPNAPRRVDSDNPVGQVKKPFRLTWWNPLCLCVAAWRQLKRLFQDPFPYPLWLDECLDIHFEPEVLRGCNRYHCESCDTISDATKSETLLALPEYLLIHMKRFEAGRFFNSKKSDSVFFPTSWRSLTKREAKQSPEDKGNVLPALPDCLDLRHYLHSSVAPFAEPIQPSLWSTDTEPHQQHHANRDDASSPASSIATTYTLDGIVNHHGGYDSGHYTVFLYKATEERQAWVYISDDEVEQAEDIVSTDTEYVLLYRRQLLVQDAPESSETEQLRRKACYYLSLSPSTSSPAANASAATAAAPHASKLHSRCPFPSSMADGVGSAPPDAESATPETWVYISRMWLQRVAFMHEPGPIVNRLCYCRPEHQGRVSMYQTLFPATVKVPAEVPHVHGPPVNWFYVPITQKDYDIFYNAFGGNAAMTRNEYESLRAMQEKFCAAIDTAERQRRKATRPAFQR